MHVEQLAVLVMEGCKATAGVQRLLHGLDLYQNCVGEIFLFDASGLHDKEVMCKCRRRSLNVGFGFDERCQAGLVICPMPLGVIFDVLNYSWAFEVPP